MATRYRCGALVFSMSDAFRKFLAFVVPTLMISTHAWATVELIKASIDLESWQPTGNNAQRLDGQWYFFDNEFLSANEDFDTTGRTRFVEVPKRWDLALRLWMIVWLWPCHLRTQVESTFGCIILVCRPMAYR